MNEVEQADRTIAAVTLLRGAPMAAVQVFTTILTRGPVSRVEISRSTGLSQAAVTKAAAPMILAGIVSDDERGRPDGQPGRPASPLRVIPEALLTVGVKVTEDEIVAVATDLLTGVLASYHLPLESTALDGVVDGICDAIAKLEVMVDGAADRIVGVGVAVSGDVDTKNGVVRQSALMGWTAVPLGALLTARLNREVVIENDVRALTIGEHWFGVGIGTASFAIVTIGRGIGCGLHLNGDVVEGAHGVAGELGHLPLTSRDHLCSCGRRGCVEAVASSEAIVREIARQRGESLTLEEAHRLARSGDPVALSVFHEAARVIGTAIATMANLAGPELIIIGGEEVRDFDLFDAELRAAFSEHAFGAAGESRIVLRPHTFEDWARGAAASVIRNLVTGGRSR